MITYADYSFYQNVYKGTMPEAEFNILSIQATMKIKTNTFNRIDEENIQEEVKFCTCLIADKLKKMQKGEGKTTERLADWSVSYCDSVENNRIIAQCISECLSNVYDSKGSALLYRGCS